MIIIQHVALYYLAHHSARESCYADNPFKMIEEFQDEVPFVILPDAIRAFCGRRQMSHFEHAPEYRDVSWMEFPSEEILKEINNENFDHMVKFHMADGYQPCVIGEETSIRDFDRHNLGHKHYHALRVHMFQDVILDEVLREELVDASMRFKDEFVVRHNKSMIINGKELRRQVTEFERIGFIKLAGIVYERTDTVLNNAWFKAVVKPALQKAYPASLSANAFEYMKLDEETDARITNLQFAITDEDRALVPMALNLDNILADMYTDAYFYTRCELL